MDSTYTILKLKYFDACEKMLWKWVAWHNSGHGRSTDENADLYVATLKLLGAIDAERGK